MKAAGVAWVFSSHTMSNQSARKSEGRLIASAPSIVSTGTRERVEIHQSPVQKLNNRRWAKQLLLALKAIVTTFSDIWKKIPSLAGQRDIDQLQVRQLMQEQDCSKSLCELNANELRKVHADALEREKIQSYKYTGH